MSGTPEQPPNQQFATPYTTAQPDSTDNAAAATLHTERPLTAARFTLHPRVQQAGVTVVLVVAAIVLYKLERALERALRTHQQ
ncbi:MAG: hypothetical protein AAF974_07350 [Cyanobacteria bacterium P01_E01_bin.34]